MIKQTEQEDSYAPARQPTLVDKNKFGFSPTLKSISIEPDSQGIPPIEVITSSNPNDIMTDDVPNTYQDIQSYEGHSCSYQVPSSSMSPTPKGTIKSTQNGEAGEQELVTKARSSISTRHNNVGGHLN